MSLSCWKIHEEEGVPGTGRAKVVGREHGEGPKVRAQKTS